MDRKIYMTESNQLTVEKAITEQIQSFIDEQPARSVSSVNIGAERSAQQKIRAFVDEYPIKKFLKMGPFQIETLQNLKKQTNQRFLRKKNKLSVDEVIVNIPEAEPFQVIEEFQDQAVGEQDTKIDYFDSQIGLLTKDQMKRSFETSSWLYYQELKQGRKDPVFMSKADWKKNAKPIHEDEVLAFDCDKVKGYKYKMQLNIAPKTYTLQEAFEKQNEQNPPKAIVRYFNNFTITHNLKVESEVHQIAAIADIAPRFYLGDCQTFIAEQFYANGALTNTDIEEYSSLQQKLMALVCKFNNNKKVMKYFTGKSRADKVDIEKVYKKIDSCKFINYSEEGLYYTFLRDIKPVYKKIMPYLKKSHPELKDQYEAIFDFFYSDMEFFVLEYARLQPITLQQLMENPHWLVIGHNSLKVEKVLHGINDSKKDELMMCDFSTACPNFRSADLCFIQDEKTQEHLIKYYLAYQYKKCLPLWTKLKIKEFDYIMEELPIFKKQLALHRQQFLLQMTLRELKGSYKWLIDENGDIKTGEDLEIAVEEKVKNQINHAQSYLEQFMQIADKDLLSRINEKYYALQVAEEIFT